MKKLLCAVSALILALPVLAQSGASSASQSPTTETGSMGTSSRTGTDSTTTTMDSANPSMKKESGSMQSEEERRATGTQTRPNSGNSQQDKEAMEDDAVGSGTMGTTTGPGAGTDMSNDNTIEREEDSEEED